MTEETGSTTEEAVVVETPAESAAVTTPAKSSSWAGKLVLALALIAAFIGLAGPVGAGWGLWDWQSGLGSLRYSFFLAIFALLLGLFVGWLNKKRGINAYHGDDCCAGLCGLDA
jgi:hypothetical protein